jgi:hypothetical protein
MSILNALKQQDGSIDELAKLPQAMIMQMAQRREIGAEMVAPILARKAQMADAVARTKALQKSGEPQPTVMEQLMQKTADAEQPELDPQEIGIASNPIPERNYAGGGIVAFQDNQDQPVNTEMRREGESENAYLERVRAVQEAGGQFFNPRNYNPLAKASDLYGMYDRNIGQPFAAGVKRFINQTPEEQAAKFNAASNARKNVSLANIAPKTEETKTKAAKTEPAKTEPAKTEPAKTDPGLKSLVEKPTAKPDVKPPRKDDAKNEIPLEQAGPAQPSELQNMIAQYRAELSGNADAVKAAKRDALNMRMLEAGLNIMGGQSSNFAQNIALASPAAKGYGEDVKGLRAEETAKRKQLADLGLKGYELTQAAKKAAAEEKYMGQRGAYYDVTGKAAMINANANAARPGAGALGAERLDVTATEKLLADARASLLGAKKADKPAIQERINMYVKRLESLGGMATPPAASASGAFNYVPGKGLVPVQ